MLRRSCVCPDTFENVAQAEDFDLLAHGDDTLLDLAGRHRTSALDGLNTFDGHEERPVDVPLLFRDVPVERIEQLVDAGAHRRVGRTLQCAPGVATDERHRWDTGDDGRFATNRRRMLRVGMAFGWCNIPIEMRRNIIRLYA